jgi:molybdenum cofactor guanylyltransferase
MITLAVLAGGEGRRMGAPKDLLLAHGKPALAALLERINWKGSTVLVAPHGERTPPGHEVFDTVVRDAMPGQGPLRGILSALSAGVGEGEVIVIPVDMPGLEREHLEWIGQQLAGRRSALGMMLKRGARIEPFPCAFRIAAAGVIQRRLDAGQLAVHALADETDVEVVSPPPEWSESVWRNVNEPGELPEGWSRSASNAG